MNDVTILGAAELARRIAAGEISAREAVDAVIGRIEQVDGQWNAVVLRRFAEARQEADEVDRRRQRGEPLGPLAGVPVTIKDCFHVAGLPTTLGLPARRNSIEAGDGELVARWRRAGAIVVGKTNVPQMMLFHECDNPLFGLTRHPLRDDRTPGGSSGGEAAIIAAGGSPLGLGSDLGGSIRIPSHFCGLVGLKPTSRRLPNRGSLVGLRGFEAMQVQAGPLARCVDDVALGLEVLAAASPEAAAWQDDGDHGPPLGDWRRVDVGRLRVAWWSDDGGFRPAPAIRRAVREAAAALQATGAEVVELPPPDAEFANALYYGLVSADGGGDLRRWLVGSPVDGRLRRMLRIARLSRPVRSLATRLLAWRGQQWQARLLRPTAAKSADEFWRLCHRLAEWRQQVFAWLADERIDAVLTPPYGLPAPPLEMAVDLLPAASYAFLPNLLGVPAGVVPWTTVAAGEESDRPPSRDGVERLAARAESGSAGLPVGVQCWAPPWRESVVLAVLAPLEAARGRLSPLDSRSRCGASAPGV